METFVRILIMAIVPVFQLMMVVWRVQFKIDTRIGHTAFICFVLSIFTATWAGSVSIGEMPSPHHEGCDHSIMESIFIFIVTMFTNGLFSIIVSLIALAEYKVALKNKGLS